MSSLHAQEPPAGDPEEPVAAENEPAEQGAASRVEREAAARCAATRADHADPGDADGIILGRVVDASTREAVPEAMVWIGTAEDVGAGGWYTTSEAGTFLLCALPRGSEIHLQAASLGLVSEPVVVRLAEERVALRDLVVSSRGLPDHVGRQTEGGAADGILVPGAKDDEQGGTATLVGTVRAAETGEPVAGARVRVLEAGEERVTGRDGAFVVPDLPRGRYRVVTEHLGLASDTVDVDLRFGSGQVAIFTLETRPVELPVLEVAVQRTLRNPRLAGFYERMARGLGKYITREDLEEADVIHNLRRRVPRVEIRECANESGLQVGSCWNLKITRGGLSERALEGVGGPCPPLIYLDGHLLPGTHVELSPGKLVHGTNAFSLLQQYPPDRIEGIEVYPNPAAAPGSYRTLGDACGIILVWTRGR